MRLFSLRRLLLTSVSAAALLLCIAQSAFADPRDFQLQNNSPVDIAFVYVSPSDMDDWGDDVMGEDVLKSGDYVNIHFRHFDGETCNYDIKVLGVGGQEGYLYQVDLCSISYVKFS